MEKLYVKGCNRGKFQWECVESYGGGKSVDVEDVALNGRWGRISRRGPKDFYAEVDDLEQEPFYDEREFTTRLNARKWCERQILRDINKTTH